MQYRNIELFCNLLLEFFLVDVKKSQNRQNLQKYLLLKFDQSFLKN